MNLLNEINTKHFTTTNISSSNIAEIGNALIIAPHADDESLGCGGVISLLTSKGYNVKVIFVTDGSQSHPNSKEYPSHKLIAIREQEAKNALEILGVPSSQIYFFHLPDAKLHALAPSILGQTVQKLQEVILDFRPQTIFVPWRKDPHPDHISSWELSLKALYTLSKTEFSAPILEYLVWFWERSSAIELPDPASVNLWKIDTEVHLPLKRKAIAAHLSQLGQPIKDDPQGFTLSEEMLRHFDTAFEFFFEYKETFSK